MQVDLLHITPDPLERIGKYAGICYNSKDEPIANRKRAIHCKDSGHLSTLRHAIATFHVVGISRICSHQFVRSKHLDFLQMSQRYVKQTNASFINPSVNAVYEDVFEYCQLAYDKLIEQGVKKEDARFVLPEATTTELIVTGNLQAWLDFVKLRSGKDAQWEIRSVAVAINNILAQECAGLFERITNED